MKYIGVDLAWSENNYSGVALLEDEKIIELKLIKGVENIAQFINLHPNAIVGVDAPLVVENESGNREIEKEFLKDYSSKKLGVYPVNRTLLTKQNKIIAGEVLASLISQRVGDKLFEVYPHVTIMNLFHGNVLPYKRKSGRNVLFIKEQLNILQNYLSEVLKGDFKEDVLSLKGQKIKDHEDKLDALVAAYTLFYCEKNPHKTYGEIFKVPLVK